MREHRYKRTAQVWGGAGLDGVHMYGKEQVQMGTWAWKRCTGTWVQVGWMGAGLGAQVWLRHTAAGGCRGPGGMVKDRVYVSRQGTRVCRRLWWLWMEGMLCGALQGSQARLEWSGVGSLLLTTPHLGLQVTFLSLLPRPEDPKAMRLDHDTDPLSPELPTLL